jgi:hypothetical protein
LRAPDSEDSAPYDGHVFRACGSTGFFVATVCVAIYRLAADQGGRDTGGFFTRYPCIGSYFTRWFSAALAHSFASLLAATFTHGPSSSRSADGEEKWEVCSIGGWGGGDG